MVMTLKRVSDYMTAKLPKSYIFFQNSILPISYCILLEGQEKASRGWLRSDVIIVSALL